jgi:hypothetical protein
MEHLYRCRERVLITSLSDSALYVAIVVPHTLRTAFSRLAEQRLFELQRFCGISNFCHRNTWAHARDAPSHNHRGPSI